MAIHPDFQIFIHTLISSAVDKLEDVSKSTSGVPFELWLRVYSPRLREVLVARGLLLWSLLAQSLMPSSAAAASALPKALGGDWRRFLGQHRLPLFDVSSGQITARANLNLAYR